MKCLKKNSGRAPDKRGIKISIFSYFFKNIYCWYSSESLEASHWAQQHVFHGEKISKHFVENSTLSWAWLPLFNLYHSLGIFSRWQIDDIFLIFPRKQDLTFDANCLLRRQFAWNVISCFLGKIRKIFQNVVCWKFYPECLALITNEFESLIFLKKIIIWARLFKANDVIS